MASKSPRIAVRAVIVNNGRLLLVNAWRAGQSRLLCAPGGGVEPGQSMPDNLAREVYEETGLTVTVEGLCLVNEFHDPHNGFHQIEVFFRCKLIGTGTIDPEWHDPEDIVLEHHWVARDEFESRLIKPDALAQVAFSPEGAPYYDPLEPIVM